MVFKTSCHQLVTLKNYQPEVEALSNQVLISHNPRQLHTLHTEN